MQGAGFSLSVYSANQIVKIGTSVDYGVCRGKRKDGMACTLVINKYVTRCSSITLFQRHIVINYSVILEVFVPFIYNICNNNSLLLFQASWNIL